MPERCMQMLKQIITEIENRQNITRDQLALLLETTDTGDIAFLHERARKTADAIYGKQVFIRGLIEFTNYCKNDCIYCGIRKSNRKAERYRLTEEEILSCCANGYELGFRTFVLQGGEDPYFTDDKICALIRQIKAQYPDCAVTLSIGEKEHDSYQAFFDAGADRYLLRHETADEAHYGKLHPAEMFWKHRMDCLWDLKEIGYQVGCGFMVGSPEQTVDTLYEDLQFIRKLQPHMVGIGPFVPQKDTPFGEKKAGIALGITGLIVGTTVFFEAGVVILIPLAFGLAKRTKKSTLYYVIPLLAGLATGFAFIPPSAGSVLVANMLGVDLGIMIAVGVPTGILSLIFAGILWSKFIGTKIHTDLPISVSEIGEEEEAKLPKFSTVILIILVPLILILCSTLSEYIPSLETIRPVLQFVGTPFVALIIAILYAMYFLGKKQGYDGEQLKKIMDRSLRPTGQILLVITGGGIIRWVLQECGMGDIIGPALEQSGLPLILAAFLIAALVRASVGAAVVAMTMAAGIMASMPEIANLSPLYLAAMVCAITGGATAFSHVNDSGFWLVSSLLEIDEKTTLKSWTMMETIIGFTGLICAFVISLFA